MSAALAKQDAQELADRVRPLLEKAKRIYGKILAGERGMERRRDAILIRAWQLGRVLMAIKSEVGHNRWLFWLGGNWQDISERSAQRAMALFKANRTLSNPQNFADLDPESVRKFMFGYVPAKERPEIAGDRPITPAPHQLTFVNYFHKFDKRIRDGLDQAPPVEVLRRDLEPVIKRIAELTGRDWLESVITS